MMRAILIANVVLLVTLIGVQVWHGPFVISKNLCPAINVLEIPGLEPPTDLFRRNPPGVDI